MLWPRNAEALHLDLPSFGEPSEVIAKYPVLARVACSPPGACYVTDARQRSRYYNPPIPFTPGPRFVRVLPKSAVDNDIHDLPRESRDGLEDIEEIDYDGDRVIVASMFVHGTSLRAISARSWRMPWSVALAIYLQARIAIETLHAEGRVHGGITPARIRLDGRFFQTVVCRAIGEPPSARDPREELAELARVVLSLAAAPGAERALVDGIESADDFSVLRDHLVEHACAPEPLVLAAFGIVPAVRPRPPDADIHALWQLVGQLAMKA